MQWPHGWYALPSPLRDVNADGHIVATIGQRLDLGGGMLPDSAGAWGCPAGSQAFSAATVEKAASSG